MIDKQFNPLSGNTTGIDELSQNIIAHETNSVTPPPPASLVSPFSPRELEIGNQIMGDQTQRQRSLGKNTPYFSNTNY